MSRLKPEISVSLVDSPAVGCRQPWQLAGDSCWPSGWQAATKRGMEEKTKKGGGGVINTNLKEINRLSLIVWVDMEV